MPIDTKPGHQNHPATRRRLERQQYAGARQQPNPRRVFWLGRVDILPVIPIPYNSSFRRKPGIQQARG